jgi:pyruvate,water dikinase
LAAEEATLDLAGGKGASLARLAAAGLPVPDGFLLTTAAYRRVVEAGDLQPRIVAALDNPDAETIIRGLFTSATIPDDVLSAIYAGYASLGSESPSVAVAVRSSATAEDLPGFSFAGQQDTFLNLRGERDVVEAIRRCWGSLWTTRAISYRKRAGIAAADVSLAVVVQLLVPADAAGVLFTVDPVSGGRDQMVINAAWGLGESLVGGHVTPDTLVVDRQSGAIVRQSVGDKSVMTVLTETGTHEVSVPPERRQLPALMPEPARELSQLGRRIEALYGQPMDIEWALQRGRMAILQARPITALMNDGEWNDSLGRDFLWTSANLGEAVPDVMTPATWSLFLRFLHGAMQANFTAGFSPVGNIGGRLYMNLSLTATQASIIFMSRSTLVGLLEQAFGRIPDDLEIPRIPISRWEVMRDLLPAGVRLQFRVRRNLQRFDQVVASVPGRVEVALQHIEAVAKPEQLRLVWFAELAPLLDDASAMLEAATRRDSGALLRARRSVSKLVGEADADVLVSGSSTSGSNLASLEPLLGLERVERGELSREAYARRYGHRGPHEFEVSIPRPAEDPEWIDRQIDGLRAAPVGVSALLEQRRAAAAAAWERLAELHPKELERVRKEVERARWGFRSREAARSEVVRVFWPLRTFYLRAGTLLSRGDDVFFLSSAELLRVLGGDATPLAEVGRRRAAYARYSALPPYPVLIRGPFDPFAWAADPNRRTDLYDARASRTPSATVQQDDVLVGFPGAPGKVEGIARVLTSPEEGAALRPGDILVTTVTNVGWTPIFPRAGAIITDVGAPLSHAAIVARELGIPAVVGTGTATQRIRSGQHVRVDGAAGTVTLQAQGHLKGGQW